MIDKDFKVQLENLAKGGIKLSSFNNDDSKLLFNVFDADSNGIIDKNEAKELAEKLSLFAQKDKNKDELSLKEAKKFIKEMKLDNKKIKPEMLIKFLEQFDDTSKNIKESYIENNNNKKVIVVIDNFNKKYSYNEDGTYNIETEELAENGETVIKTDYFNAENQREKTVEQYPKKTFTTIYNSEGFKIKQIKTPQELLITDTLNYDGKGNTEILLQKNDNIDKIAQKFNVTKEELLKLNGGQFPEEPGETFLVPGELSMTDSRITNAGNKGFILSYKIFDLLREKKEELIDNGEVHTYMGYRENIENKEELKTLISSINSENINAVFNGFACLDGGDFNPTKYREFNKNLLKSIIKTDALSKDEKMEFINHIKNVLIDYTREKGMQSPTPQEIEDYFSKEISYQFSPEADMFFYNQSAHLDAYVFNILDRDTNIGMPENVNTNGLIDGNFSQNSKSADCWLLSMIRGFTRSDKGREILNNSLKKLPDGTIEVNLKGIGKKYSISEKELAESNNLANGDMDIRAFEIALDKYFRDTHDPVVGITSSIHMGNPSKAWTYITGLEDNENFERMYMNKDAKFVLNEDAIKDFNSPNKIYIVASKKGVSEEFELPDGKKTKLHNGHSYTVIGSDAQSIKVYDSLGTPTEYSVPKEIFCNYFRNANFYVYDLNDI